MRRYRERVRAEQAAIEGDRDALGRLVPGNSVSRTAALMHGAYSPQLVSDVARELVAELLARPSTPQRLRDDPDDELLQAWGTTAAICRLLRSAVTTGNIKQAMTERLAEDEMSTHPSALAAGKRRMRGKRTPSVLEQLARYQTQLLGLSKALGLDAASRRMAGEGQGESIDLAKYWAQRDGEAG